MLEASMREPAVIIACLHTAESNVAVFEAAAHELGLADGLRHAVRPDLLEAAERVGGLRDDIARQTAAALMALGEQADAVLLTCSTLGPSVALVAKSPVPVLRVDAALAERAGAHGGKVMVLCAVETTVAPTTGLFAEVAKRRGVALEVRLVPGAWALFRAGDHDGYLAAIARAADAAYDDGAGVVALAQASMAGAVDLVRGEARPMTSPAAGLSAALELIRAARLALPAKDKGFDS